MKPRRLNLIRSLVLFGVLLAALKTQARPPIQHAAQGVIQSVDLTNHTLALSEPKVATSRIFIWKDSTRFRLDGQKASPDSFRAGRTIKVYYRRESGKLVLREVRWSEASLGRSSSPAKTPAQP